MTDADVAGQLAAGFAGAWNRHDMTALAGLFHDDATFVNGVGTCMRGREDIRYSHAVAHDDYYRNSTLRTEVEDVRELVPGVIVAHVRTEVRGDERVPGQVSQSVLTAVIEQRAGRWGIVTGHNTIVAASPG